jgi:hypothetical protein
MSAYAGRQGLVAKVISAPRKPLCSAVVNFYSTASASPDLPAEFVVMSAFQCSITARQVATI